MSPKAGLSVRKHAFGPESEDELLKETILQWQSLGSVAAWQAIYDMLDWWFESRGLDPATQRVDRTHVEIHPVPWLAPGSEVARRA